MNQAAIPSLAEDLKKLNEQQTAIIRKFNRPSLIVAGPGTGKTRTISVLIGDLLQKGTRLREILALTFSDKAALELRERVLQYYPHSFDQCWISTFHSFCARILREQYWLVGIKPDFKLLTGFKEALMMST
ncbi:MAG TPA: UvrD-helicase domain-containing protein, partial [Candidatus Rifleibacterium sp.]|nr:UvrD-helicase domain-containing protein [Candidatus Rifleibacterium sp.]